MHSICRSKAYPRISVVTPSFNQGEYIEQCIKSVVDQGYPELEYIVVDGGSTDKTISVLEFYSNRIHRIICESDNGHAHALNKGFALSTGTILCWINSDDILTPNSLWAVASIFRDLPHVQWITGCHSILSNAGFIIESGKKNKNMYDYVIKNYKWIQQESTFWRRSLWEASGSCINDSMAFMVDGELWSRFFLNADLYGVDALLGSWRYTGANRSSLNSDICNREMLDVVMRLRANLPSASLESAKLALSISKVADSRLAIKLRLDVLLWKLLLAISPSRLVECLSYKRIRYHRDRSRWSVYCQPFR